MRVRKLQVSVFLIIVGLFFSHCLCFAQEIASGSEKLLGDKPETDTEIAKAAPWLKLTGLVQPQQLSGLRSFSTADFSSSNALPGYTLLDPIETDWLKSSSNNTNTTVQTMVQSPFSSPAGGLALYQSTIGYSYFGCDLNYYYKEFQLGKEYFPGSFILPAE